MFTGTRATIESNGGLRRASIGAKLFPRALMTTLLRSYRLVSAHLYRMQDRLAIAEDAWDRARPTDLSETAIFDQSSVQRLESARDNAIAIILECMQCEAIRTRAIAAVVEAVRSALDESFRERYSGPTVLASP
jgi:hypothetical protein